MRRCKTRVATSQSSWESFTLASPGTAAIVPQEHVLGKSPVGDAESPTALQPCDHGLGTLRRLRLWLQRPLALLAEEHLRKSVLAMVDQAVVSLAAFATVAILGRFAGQSELGRYYLPFTILLFTVNVQGELVTSAYAVYRHRRTGRQLREYSGSVMVFEGVMAFTGMCLFWGLWAASRYGWMPRELADCFFVLGLAAPAWQIRAFLRYYSFANLQFFAPLVMDSVATVSQLVILFSLVGAGWLLASTVHAALGVACLLGVAAWVAYDRPKVRINRSRLWRDWKENWSFSRWALVSQLIGCGAPYVVPWLVARHLGHPAAGVLAACTNLCGISTMFVLGIAHSLTPHAARAYATGGVAHLRRVLWRSAIAFAVGLTLFCMVMFFSGEFLMGALYGPQFTDTGWTLVLLSLATLANSMAIVAGNGLWAIDRPRANLWADAVTLLVTLGATEILLPVAGVAGVAGAILLGNSLGAATRVGVLLMMLDDLASHPLVSVGTK